MSAFTIRNATPADIPAITRIYEEAVLYGTATYELTPPDETEMAARMANTLRQDYPYFVACDRDGAVIGYAYAGPFRARPAYRWTVEDSIYLAPEAKGQGVGTALLRRLLDACQDKGFRQMIAVIGGADNQPSIKVHAKLGFTHIGIFEGSGFKFGRWIDTVFMQFALNGGKETLPDETVYPGTLT
ncbi:GNAT family N-acetyltransferase [Aureimonas phyllosphaerae]|uniref:Phosphinothricin acetyltransferase n=1 Tax=Aureimonas phyllosphaerae TaxID=1166078 RepID=A0A7W6BWE7_9HYPH|nr:GNAT family N-acetyltransferase [Aureimonas phyllosphaerae]MBB3934032.1 phosphinothricin acetyltransferase [Aureimonas phyllosphaerae]MBB3958752.1 phosphinothricin acetyltransferase [Aureimonas phyllosphaerae]SFF18822.1 phosphinothricin acetyltransferase [Aureimonas phyllosphaerae]